MVGSCMVPHDVGYFFHATTNAKEGIKSYCLHADKNIKLVIKIKKINELNKWFWFIVLCKVSV